MFYDNDRSAETHASHLIAYNFSYTNIFLLVFVYLLPTVNDNNNSNKNI